MAMIARGANKLCTYHTKSDCKAYAGDNFQRSYAERENKTKNQSG